MIGCTIIARNYLAQARVLARSFRQHHPDGAFFVLVLDGPLDQAPDEPFESLAPDDLAIERREFQRMAAMYSVLELSTAVKPWLLQALLNRGFPQVAYLDADMLVLSSLDDISALARQHGIVLTPHLTAPLPPDGRTIGEREIRLAGAFNLGFICVSEEAAEFLDWWSQHLSRACVVDVERGLFVDQRYIDVVPGMFGAHVLRDPTINVAYWNAHARPVEWDGERYLIHDQPLRLFHFSGFDPREPWLLSRHQGNRPRVLLSEHPGIDRLCRDYSNALFDNGFAACADSPYGFGSLPTGLPLDGRTRRVYRAALEAAESNGEQEPPDPFAPAVAAQFVDWLNAPVVPSGVSRYLKALYDERPDLRFVFPDIAGRDADRFLQWVATEGRHQEEIAPELVPAPLAGTAPAGVPDAATALEGVNVVGLLTSEQGVGEAARQVVGALEQATIPFSAIVHRTTLSRQEHQFRDDGLPAARFDTNLICMNADALPGFRASVGPALFDGRYTIGFWWWEVDVLPATIGPALDLVDEVWAGSSFVARNIASATDKPVVTVPLPIDAPLRSGRTRQELGLPDGFLFLFSFDVGSVFERKNPLALVEAFTRAFSPNEGPVLVIKSINGDRFPAQLERLRHATRGRDDIHVVDGYLDQLDKNALMALCDCYVSLHRSEGFGLTLAEAMALGKPVIATGYGGNVDFMNDENSFLVDWREIPVGPGCYPYPPEAVWADPDVDHAVQLMREVTGGSGEARRRAAVGKTSLLSSHSREQAAAAIAGRLAEIRAVRRGEAAAALAGPVPAPAVERSRAWLENGPTIPWDAPSRLGFVGRGVRRGLRRALRPYELRERELDRILVDALMELNHLTRHLQEEQAAAGRRSRALEDATRASLSIERARLEALRHESVRAAARLGEAVDDLRAER